VAVCRQLVPLYSRLVPAALVSAAAARAGAGGGGVDSVARLCRNVSSSHRPSPLSTAAAAAATDAWQT